MNVAKANAAQIIDQNFDSSDWLSAVEAASYLRILSRDGSPCVARIRNLVHLGRIPFYKPYGRLLFKRSELWTLVESSRKGGFKWR